MGFFKAFPEAAGATIPLGDVTYRPWNIDPLEQYCIAAIARARRPPTIFEIGTFDGSTTLLLAKVLPEARIWTLDLPPDSYVPPARPDRDPRDSDTTPRSDQVGARFRGEPEEKRITQLLGDSRTFAFDEYVGRMDMVIVDGSHDYDCVRADTENALRLTTPNATIIWDDYSIRWPGVVRAVDEVAERDRLTILRLAPTDLAVLDRTREQQAPSPPRR